VAVKELNHEIVFLHKIIPGGTDDSYGIYVAKLAGIPQEIIHRSKQILTKLELSGKLHEKIRHGQKQESQISMFEDNPADTAMKEINEEITGLEINSLTPLQITNKVQEWKEKLEKNGKNTSASSRADK